jgi:hypothetical protein
MAAVVQRRPQTRFERTAEGRPVEKRPEEDDVRTTRAFLTGIGVAYFFDLEQGKRRRRVLRDRTLRLVRRGVRVGVKRSRFAAGLFAGLLARARSRVVPPVRAVDDGTVVQRIRSEALRDVGVSTTDVDVEVRDGVAVLRGAVATRSLADDLVARVRSVPGVRDVENTLDVVGPPVSG